MPWESPCAGTLPVLLVVFPRHPALAALFVNEIELVTTRLLLKEHVPSSFVFSSRTPGDISNGDGLTKNKKIL
jgi:hypothetical protein